MRYDSRELGRNLTPASPEQMERLRAIERERRKWDKSYITAEEARSIPSEVADKDPVLQSRIAASAPDWPERQQSAGHVFRDVEGGCGESIERRNVDSESLFTGGPVVPKDG